MAPDLIQFLRIRKCGSQLYHGNQLANSSKTGILENLNSGNACNNAFVADPGVKASHVGTPHVVLCPVAVLLCYNRLLVS